MLRLTASPDSNDWPRPTSVIGPSWKRSPEGNLRGGCDAGDVVVLDVRPVTEYDAGHIAVHDRFRFENCNAIYARSRKRKRLSRTAAARIACTPTTPCAS